MAGNWLQYVGSVTTATGAITAIGGFFFNWFGKGRPKRELFVGAGVAMGLGILAVLAGWSIKPDPNSGTTKPAGASSVRPYEDAHPITRTFDCGTAGTVVLDLRASTASMPSTLGAQDPGTLYRDVPKWPAEIADVERPGWDTNGMLQRGHQWSEFWLWNSNDELVFYSLERAPSISLTVVKIVPMTVSEYDSMMLEVNERAGKWMPSANHVQDQRTAYADRFVQAIDDTVGKKWDPAKNPQLDPRLGVPVACRQTAS
jgi:hypothetical protein